MRTDSKSEIKLLNLTVFFSLLGSALIKAACRILVKLTPDIRALCKCKTIFKERSHFFLNRKIIC